MEMDNPITARTYWAIPVLPTMLPDLASYAAFDGLDVRLTADA